jgi:hypothetical protein
VKTSLKTGIVLRPLTLLILIGGCVVHTSDPPFAANENGKKILVKEYSPELALKWYELELKLIRREPGFTPPIAARLIGYTGITLYESMVGGMPEYHSLSEILNMPVMPVVKEKNYSYVISANAAFSFALKHFIPSLSSKDIIEIDSVETYFNNKYGKEIDRLQFGNSLDYGRRIANIIYQWSKTDGGNDGHFNKYKPYLSSPSLPGMWEATSFSGALLPDWGKNRPFLLDNVSKCQPPPPPAYSDKKDSDLFREAMEVYKVFLNLTSEQSDIAKFWADPPGSTFTPAGHSVQLLCKVIRGKDLALDSAAIAFAKCGIALNDAFISCWHTKYNYNYIRPITYIRKNIRKDWLSFVTTPSFPEYPSGHSVQSAAMAEVMTSMFGAKYSFWDNSNDTLGYGSRHYNSFKEFANEAAISRLYGGIHFRISIENGLLQGQKIGDNVNKISFKKE